MGRPASLDRLVTLPQGGPDSHRIDRQIRIEIHTDRSLEVSMGSRYSGEPAALVRGFFMALVVKVGVDPVPPAQASSLFADAVAAVAGASVAAVSRWPGIGEVPPWWLACAASGGRLLAPGWPQ